MLEVKNIVLFGFVVLVVTIGQVNIGGFIVSLAVFIDCGSIVDSFNSSHFLWYSGSQIGVFLKYGFVIKDFGMVIAFLNLLIFVLPYYR